MSGGCDACIAGLGSLWKVEGQYRGRGGRASRSAADRCHTISRLFSTWEIWPFKANQPQQAVGLLEAAVKQRPKDADAHQQLADGVCVIGTRLATRWCSCARPSRLSPANPDLHALLSQALASTGQLEQAIAERKAALRLRANNADDWNNLGVLEARAGRITEAREDFLHALQLAPDHAQARNNLQHLPPA